MARILIITVALALLAGVLLYKAPQQENLVVSGLVEADVIRVGSRIGGRVAEVRIEEGDLVSKGQALVILEPFDLQEKRTEAEARVSEAQAELKRLQNGFRKEEIAQASARRDQRAAVLERLIAGPRAEDLAAAQARVELAQAKTELARQESERADFLHADQITSQEDADRRATELRVASSELVARKQELAVLANGSRAEDIERARAELAEADASLRLVSEGYRPEEVARAKAQEQATIAALAAIDQRIAELTIRSPLEGRIDAVSLRPGDLVAADAPVLSLVDPNRLWVRSFVPEDRLNLDVDQVVTVAVDSFPDRKFSGRIRFVAQVGEFTPRNIQSSQERVTQVFRVKVVLEDEHSGLRPGMAADVIFEPKRGHE